MNKFTALCAAFLLTALTSLSAQTSFVITADSSQEVPANGSSAVGTAVGWLDASNMLTISFEHNVVNASAAHIHAAPAGANGGVVFPFSSAASGHTQTFGPLTVGQVQTLMTAGMYLNIHSAAFGGGEIRGQLDPTFAPQVYISEICSDPLGVVGIDPNQDGAPATSGTQSDDEFVEIINGSCDPVDISGWTVSDSALVRHTFATGTILPPFGCVVVFGGGSVTNFNASGCAGVTASSGALGLNNTSDTVTLADAASMTVDSYSYTDGTSDDGDGESIVRVTQQPSSAMVMHTGASPGGLFHSAGSSSDGLFKFAPAMLPAPPTPMYPGNGSDVAVDVRVNGVPVTNVPGVYSVLTTDIFSMTFNSPGGTLTNMPFLAFAQIHTTGAPPLPESVVGAYFLASIPTFVLIDGLSNPLDLFNPVLGFYQLTGTMPPALGGSNFSVLVNCFAMDPTKPFNLGIANAQEFQVQ